MEPGGGRGSSPAVLKNTLKREPSNYIALTDDLEKAHCIISSKLGRFQLQFNTTDNTVFETLHSYRSTSFNGLIQDLESIAKWLQIKNLNNPRSFIEDRDLEMEFYRVLETTDDFLHAAKQELVEDFTKNAVHLEYHLNPNEPDPQFQWEEPSFRLKLKNPEHNFRPLWVSVLLLGSDFSIKNELRPPQQLKPGEEVWMESFDTDYQVFTKVIPLNLDDFHEAKGLNSITEYFKIILSTEQLDTFIFNQDGLVLNPDAQRITRGQGRRSRRKPVDNTDWKAIDFAVKVIKTKPPT